MKLNLFLQNKNNGLTQSRLILAFFVLYDHQYAILDAQKPIIFNGMLSFSSLAVYLFMFMSGMLCFESRKRNTNTLYLIKRFARIFPGYCTALLVTSTIFIPIYFLITNEIASIQAPSSRHFQKYEINATP